MTYRGTTPKHIFYFPFDQNEVSVLKITYFQKGKVRFTKNLSDVTFQPDEETITLQLSQEDTLSFERYSWLDKAKDSLIWVQIRVKLTNGNCLASDMMKDRLGDILLDEVI